MSDDMREAQPSPIVEGKWPEGGPQSSTVIYLDAPPINVVVGMLCVLCEHARPGSLDTVPGLMAMVRETAQKLAAQPSAQGEPQCDRSRQINMDRDRLWEENGIPAAQPEPSAQGEAVECPCPPGVCRGGYPESCRTTLARFERESAPAAPAQAEQLEAMVDKAWLRFEAEDQRLKLKKSERVRALVNAGSFPGMSEAFDAHMGAECWTDPAYQPDASTWAAAWKAAKRDSAAQPVSGALTFDEWWFQEETVNALECAKTVQDECRIAWNAARGIKAAP